MSHEFYPDRDVLVCEMLAAWKQRNRAVQLAQVSIHEGRSLQLIVSVQSRDYAIARLTSLRRVWHALRDAR